MLRRIIIAHDYVEGSASTNRVLGFAKGYRANGMEVALLFFNPRGNVVLPDGISDVLCIREPDIPFRLTRRLLAVCRYVREIKKAYVPGCTAIHIYRTPLWGYLFNRRKYNFYFERGEIPFYSDSRSILYRIRERLGLRVTRRASGMLVQTYSLKEYYEAYGVRNIVTVNMFVDTDRFKGIVPEKDRKYIAYCGTLSKQKDGIDVLIKAFDLVRRRHADYRLMLIGGFEDLYNDEDEIRSLVESLGLSESIIMTGLVNPAEIPQLLSNASILAMARRPNKQTRYGFPTKLGEYLCTGNPVVLTNVGEVGMYLKDKENCIFAEPGDVEDLADKFCWVISHPEEAGRIGLAGKKLIDKDFSIVSETRKAIELMDR